MDKIETCRKVKEYAKRAIDEYKAHLVAAGLLVDHPKCGWQVEQQILFNDFKHKVLADAEINCQMILNEK